MSPAGKWRGSFALLILACAVGTKANETNEPKWHKNPFRIQAGAQPLDTAAYDGNAHAAPFLADMDGDGRRDLVVGSFSGQFRLFLNIGTNASPEFDGKSDWLMTPDQTARVPTWCCVAAGPQIVDIDADGVGDLSAGSYAPGAFYWFKGLGDGAFNARHMLVDSEGRPIISHPEVLYVTAEKYKSYAAQLAWADWNFDGALDLIMGNWVGELFVREQSTDYERQLFQPAVKSQTVFGIGAVGLHEIRIEGNKAIPDRHSAPAIADWDGDGLWDILSGSESGAVYLFKNTGKENAPEFRTREQIVPPGIAVQWLEHGDLLQRGGRSQIQAVDFNLDGKLDLLVGAWTLSQSPRRDLSKSERKELEALRRQLRALDEKVGFDYSTTRYKHPGYNRQLAAESASRLAALEKQLVPYLVATEEDGIVSALHDHGHIWVFLRR